MTKHIETRRKISDIADIETFTDLLNRTTLSELDKEIMELHYVKDKDFKFIGDTFGYSESGIKKRHKRILSKLNKMY